MKRIRRICLGSIAFLASVILLTGCTNDAVIDEYGYRESAYPQISASSADVFPIPLDQQVKYADLVIEGEVISVNPSEPAVYTYREGDIGVDFMKEEGIFHMEYELFTYQVRVTAIHKGTNRLLKDWLECWKPGCDEFVVKICIPPVMRDRNNARYTNVKIGDKLLLFLVDYADRMYVPASLSYSAFIIRDGTAYVTDYQTEWCEEQDKVILIPEPLYESGYSYREIIRQIKDGLGEM